MKGSFVRRISFSFFMLAMHVLGEAVLPFFNQFFDRILELIVVIGVMTMASVEAAIF
jgi:hypothetical protein